MDIRKVFLGMKEFEFNNLLSILQSNEETKLRGMFYNSKLTFFSLYTKTWIQERFWRGKIKRPRPTTGLIA